MHSRVWRDGALIDGAIVGVDASIDAIARVRTDADVVWVDLVRPTGDDIAALASLCGGTSRVHPLTLSALGRTHNRPRLVRYDDHRIVYARAVRWDPATQRVHTTDVTFLVFDRTLVTVRSDDAFRLVPVVDEWESDGVSPGRGVPYLLHAMLDTLVDGCFEVIDALDDAVQGLEDDMIDGNGPSRSLQVETFTVRRAIATLSRVLLPMNEVFSALLRQGATPLDPALLPYYQDVYDHALRASERVDGLRDSVESILATGLAMQGNSLNEIMRKLTAWAAIIAIPTGVTGFFGQNVPFPGFGEKGGFWLSAVLLVLLAGGLWIGFTRRGWL